MTGDATPFTEDYELEAIAWVNTAIIIEQGDDYKGKAKSQMVTAYASIANVYATLALAKAQKNDRVQES